MAERVAVTFKRDTVTKVLQSNFSDEKTKINNDAAKLVVETLRVFATEGAQRSCRKAKSEDSALVTPEHFEKTIPQLLLDF